MNDLNKYRKETLAELTDNILAYWLKNVVDFDLDSFHGYIDGKGVVDPKADKGVILATRILWAFSRAHTKLKDEKYLRAAELMARYIRDHFLDKEHGGVFWMLDSEGAAVDKTKKFYGQAFAIYAFAEYFEASGDRQALSEAKKLFDLMEKHGRDHVEGGYIDAVGSDWSPIPDTRLSDKDLNTPKSMNTNLHVLEAYAELAKQDPKGPVVEALESLVNIFLDKIIRPNRHFGLFFDHSWNEVSGNISYGHDIEGSWLLFEAAERTGNESLVKKVTPIAVEMAHVAMEEALDAEGGVLSEREKNGTLKPDKEWWMTAEAMVGFFNTYELTGNDAYLEKSISAWKFCKKYFVRPDGEWYEAINDKGEPYFDRELVGPWKCPYHSGRACMEIIERTGHLK
jgi:mannobiose 2-epimerase